MPEGVIPMEPTEYEDAVCSNCYFHELAQMFGHPFIVGVTPCNPPCIHELKQALPCPAGTATFTIVNDNDRLWYVRLCVHRGEGALK